MDAPLQAIIAAAISFIFISGIFATIYILCSCCKDNSAKNSDLETQPRPRSRPRPRNKHSSVSTQSSAVAADESVSFDPAVNSISMTELSAATNNFSPELIIGDGGFGFVYKAELASGVTVAVKRLSADAFHGFREFRAEMDTLGHIQHRNLVRLLAFCISGRDRVLIYEFLDGGSLDQWLHYPDSVEPGLNSAGLALNSDLTTQLSWSTRLGIIRGVANGLSFLHEECSPPIIHRDIKASNVLLDGELEARIADFGLARQVNPELRSIVLTQAAGTIGYMPPEYINGTTTMATMKGDVYSFGILMLEVITRRRPNIAIRVENGKEMGLAQWAQNMVKDGRGIEILDPDIREESEGLGKEKVEGFLQLALKCVSGNPNSRPTMCEAIHMLNQL